MISAIHRTLPLLHWWSEIAKVTHVVYLLFTKRLHDSWGGLHSLVKTYITGPCSVDSPLFPGGAARGSLPRTREVTSLGSTQEFSLFSQWTWRDFCFQCCIWMLVVIFIPWFWIICANLPPSLKKNAWGSFPLECVMSERTKFNQAQLPILATAIGQTLRNQRAEIIAGCQYCLRRGKLYFAFKNFPETREGLFIHPGKKVHLLCYMSQTSEFSNGI